MSKDQPILIQPVQNPIMCPPYKESEQHPLYDTRTGIPSKDTGASAGKPADIAV